MTLPEQDPKCCYQIGSPTKNGIKFEQHLKAGEKDCAVIPGARKSRQPKCCKIWLCPRLPQGS